MDYDYNKRDYLLPEGCKDLIDVLKPKAQPVQLPTPLPPILGELTIQEQMTVCELASALRQKPFKIIADLMGVGVFATVQQQIGFETIAKVVRKYGYTAKKAV